MKAWSEFYPDVLPHVPGAPDPVVEHELKRAAQEFFEETGAWRAWLADIETLADTTDYDLQPADGLSEVFRLERATLDGRPIAVRTEAQLPDDWKTYPEGLSVGVHTPDSRTLILLPAQPAELVLKVEAFLKPSETATGIDDIPFAMHVKDIAAGAIANIKMYTGAGYSDPDGGMMWRGRFAEAMDLHAFRRFRGFSSARPRRQVKTF